MGELMRIILNPLSRHGAGRKMRPELERLLRQRGVQYELVETRAPTHAADLAQQAAEAGVSHVIAAGGDGTVHEVVNGLMQAGGGPVLGLLPIGTGNDFVKMVPGTATLEHAVDTLVCGVAHPLDVGYAAWDGGGEYFANAMGTGIDVEVVRRMRRSRMLPGGFIYVAALLRALASYRPRQLLLELDDVPHDRQIMNLAVCNGPSIGGSFRICPDALTDDGLLDVCVVAAMPLVRNAAMVPHVIRGTHVNRRGVTMARASTIRMGRPEGGQMWFQLDGELRCAEDGVSGIRVHVHAGALQVLHGPVGSRGGRARLPHSGARR